MDASTPSRILVAAECKEELEFGGASEIAQIIQGVGFLGLAVFLIFANNAKVGTNAKAPLEARYTVSCTIATAVCLFSGFFNILQMTSLDDFDLPRSTNFTLDISRPVEWILTCPIMQLILVIIGGARLPSYRRFMMPLLTAGNLLCGIAAMFSEGAMKWAWFGFGGILFSLYTYYNAQQIVENSDGEESFFKGDSDYRKLSVIVTLTWFPFPLWFFLSPEGFGLVEDITVIQLGWAVLNVVAKFGFILHLQHIKTKYCTKLDATRELYGIQPGGHVPDEKDLLNMQMVGPDGVATKPDKAFGAEAEPGDEDELGEAKVINLIQETMVSIGLSAHTDRFQKLMLDNGICSTDILERLTQDRSIDLDLPWSLVDAVQKRWKNEKMDLGQDRGGLVEKQDPFKKLLDEGKKRRAGNHAVLPSQSFPQFDLYQQAALAGVLTPPLAPQAAPVDLEPMNQRMDGFEHYLSSIMSELGSLRSMMSEMGQKVEVSQDAICQRMDFSQVSLLQTVNSCQVLLHKVDSAQEGVINKVEGQKAIIEKVSNSQDRLLDVVTGSSDSAKQALLETVTSSSDVLLKKLNLSQQQLMEKTTEAYAVLNQVSTSQEQMSRKMDSNAEAISRRTVESENHLTQKLDGVVREVVNVCETQVGKLNKSLHSDMSTLASQTESTTSVLERGVSMQEERMADITRQNMMVMDMLTTTQERVSTSADSVERFTRQDMMRSSEACLSCLTLSRRP
jgi:bacteriorhodopsin